VPCKFFGDFWKINYTKEHYRIWDKGVIKYILGSLFLYRGGEHGKWQKKTMENDDNVI